MIELIEERQWKVTGNAWGSTKSYLATVGYSSDEKIYTLENVILRANFPVSARAVMIMPFPANRIHSQHLKSVQIDNWKYVIRD